VTNRVRKANAIALAYLPGWFPTLFKRRLPVIESKPDRQNQRNPLQVCQSSNAPLAVLSSRAPIRFKEMGQAAMEFYTRTKQFSRVTDRATNHAGQNGKTIPPMTAEDFIYRKDPCSGLPEVALRGRIG